MPLVGALGYLGRLRELVAAMQEIRSRDSFLDLVS